MTGRSEPTMFPDLVPTEPVILTDGQRRRARQDARIAHGVHPITGLRIRPSTESCGTCKHRVLIGGHAKDWPKCDLMGSRNTHGPGTDCLARFPACTGWEAA